MSLDLSDVAIERVRTLAITAAQNDNWMEPLLDDIKTSSFDEFVDENRRHWEETEHFEHYYGREISAITDREDMLAGRLDSESRLYDIYLPLLDLFWESWADAIDLYSKWKIVKAKNRRLHRLISPHGMCKTYCVEHERDPSVEACKKRRSR